MSFLFRQAEQRSDPSWYETGESSRSSVSEGKATCLAPVFATFRHLVDYVSTLPADFYRIEGSKRVKVGMPELIRNVDAEFGLSNWLGQAVYAIASRGNAVGEVKSLSGWTLPSMVQWASDWSGGDDGSAWYINGLPKPSSLVAHIPWIVPPGKRLGLSPIEHFAAIVNAGLSAQDYADVKRGGGIPPSILQNTTQLLDPEQATAVQSRAVRAFASGRPFITGKDWNLTVPSIPPNHAQFIETLKLSANQIAAIYGIDPREIGGSAAESLTYTNDESRALNRAQNASPYIVRIENAVSRMLPQMTVMKLNTDARIRADIKTRTEVIGAQIEDGRLSVNEARALEDREPVPGGDFHNVPAPKADPTQRDGVSP